MTAVSVQPGPLTVTPHKAMRYAGERDRIIASFNAQLRAPGGEQLFRHAGA